MNEVSTKSVIEDNHLSTSTTEQRAGTTARMLRPASKNLSFFFLPNNTAFLIMGLVFLFNITLILLICFALRIRVLRQRRKRREQPKTKGKTRSYSESMKSFFAPFVGKVPHSAPRTLRLQETVMSEDNTSVENEIATPSSTPVVEYSKVMQQEVKASSEVRTAENIV
ncbi:unnamed protein product [Cylicocyclus nassatus]|uniref:Uncharacterized protein n=1 Tax=Cylicocyclus nassatus TaxID=53992 RepID=A0AA36HB42_CYLNA|nr:unnamed protein product [Cylicocyclus nassatus]